MIIVLMVAGLQGFAFAAVSSQASPQYLHVTGGIEADFFQFNERGVFVPQTEIPVALKEGWIVLSGQDPVILSGPFGLIALQRESILTIGSTDGKALSFYLVAGSGNFYADTAFSGTMEVSTPVGIYRLTGPGEMFVSSDYAELVFSLGGEVHVMNTITRQIADLPPFTYLNLADPFVHEKQISRQTYETLSIRPNKATTRLLPSASVEDGLRFETPSELFPVKEEPVSPTVSETSAPLPTPAVAAVIPAPIVVPVAVKSGTTTRTQEISIAEKPAEGLTLTVSVAASAPASSDISESISGVPAEPPVAIPVEEAPAQTVTAIPVEEAPVEPPIAIPVGEVPVETVAAVPVDEAPVETVAAVTVEKTPVETFDVYVVHTNDVLGGVEDGIGYARLATLLSWGRELSDRNLVLDAGNATSGTPITDSFAGETVGILLDMLGYDAVAPGPADYAFGIERLKEAARYASENSDIKVLAANVLDANGMQVFEPYGIYDLKGYTVGVIGLSVPAENIQGFSFLSDTVISNAQALVDEVAAQTDFVILLGDVGTSHGITSEEIARSIHGVDLIIDGAEAMTPAGGRIIGNTLIVNAGEKLSSVGIVEIKVVDGEVDGMHALRIEAEDVLDPANSSLAQAYGVTVVPPNTDVQAYIDGQKQRLAAMTTAPEVQVEVPKVSVAVSEPEPVSIPSEELPEVLIEQPAAVETAVIPPKDADDSLTIKAPLGITGSPSDASAESFDYGVSSTFSVSRTGIGSTQDDNTLLAGISINPFFSRNSFAIGLQAYFLTDESLFYPSTYAYTNFDWESGTLGTIGGVLRFIDYIRYGSADDTFYLLADGTTPITFGQRLLVNGLAVASGPYEENLGLYSSGRFGNFGYELFIDDLYMSSLINEDNQIGGVRISYAPASRISIGLSSLVKTDLDATRLYPMLDGTWTVTDSRKLKADVFAGIATALDAQPFSFDPLYNASGSGFADQFPNFLFALGTDIRTLRWDFRLVGAVQNSNDPIVSLGSLNPSSYTSGLYDGTAMTAADTVHYSIGAEAGYRGDNFSVEGSWYVPIDWDFSRIIPLATDADTTADMLRIEAAYSKPNFEAAIGFHRVGFLSSFSDLLDFSDFSSDIESFLFEDINAQPYLSLRYRSGLFAIHGDIFLNTAGRPRFDFGTTVTVGKKALEGAIDPSASYAAIGAQETEKDKLAVSVDLRSAYTRTFPEGDDHSYLTVQPVVTLANQSFSLGIGPLISVDLDEAKFYSHDDSSAFSFGSSYDSTFGTLYDVTTDVFNLIDHLYVGSEDDAFQLAIDRNQTVSMGPTVQNLTTITDSMLQNRVGLTAAYDTRTVDLNLFLDDLTEWQLGGLRIGFSPFKNPEAEIAVSAIGSFLFEDDAKRIDLLPSIDAILPILSHDNLSLNARGSMTTMLGYDTVDGFDQMFYTSGSTFFANFDNYLFTAGLNLASGDFTFALDAGMQKGTVSYGMFNPLFTRERTALVEAFSDEWTADNATDRSWVVAASLGWNRGNYGVETSYMIPITKDFVSWETDRDLLMLKGYLDLSWVDLSLAYTRRAFASDIGAVFSGSDSLLNRFRTFVSDPGSALSLGASVSQGPITFNATVSTLASLSSDGSWNGLILDSSADVVDPTLTLGVDIAIF